MGLVNVYNGVVGDIIPPAFTRGPLLPRGDRGDVNERDPASSVLIGGRFTALPFWAALRLLFDDLTRSGGVDGMVWYMSVGTGGGSVAGGLPGAPFLLRVLMFVVLISMTAAVSGDGIRLLELEE